MADRPPGDWRRPWFRGIPTDYEAALTQFVPSAAGNVTGWARDSAGVAWSRRRQRDSTGP